MSARPSDADRQSSMPSAVNTPIPAAGDSIPVTSGPRPDLPSTAHHPASLIGVPAELRDHPIYEVQKELGRGGMGVVYLARQKLIGRLEVLKVLQDRLAGRPDLLARFTNEVQMAGRLSHPNIVIAYGAFPAGNALVLAMEYVEGRTLAEVVQRKGPLSVVHACAFARQIALGLQRAHEEGMVHRDIKPQNVMLSRRGEVKVLDFGLAKVASEEAETGLTGTGVMMGTPDYMPPEQAIDAKSADIRADIYSLGCTLFFLLTGRSPFSGRSSYEVMHAHQTLPPPPLPGAPPGLAALVARMLAKRPEDRPQTPGEVARALAAMLQPEGKSGDRPTASVPPPPPPPRQAARPGSTVPLPRPAPRRRGGAVGLVLGVGTAGLALLALLASLWAGGVFSGRSVGPEGPGAVASEKGSGRDRPQASEKPAGPGAAKGDEKKAAPPPAKVKEKAKPPREITNTIGMKLVLIPAGRFQMGSPVGEANRSNDEGPRHEVEISRPFYLGVYEVTQGEYEEVMKGHPTIDPRPSWFQVGKGGADKLGGITDTSGFPVENVSWEEAVEFCKRLTEKEKKEGKIGSEQEYCLPTEAQWEYACRGGAASYHIFHFGDKLSSAEANFDGNYPHGGADKGTHLQRTARVGSYKPNAFGLYDMHGNVWEWCHDWYSSDTYNTGPYPRVNPRGPEKGSLRVCRGGSWGYGGQLCRSAFRGDDGPASRSSNLGFRVSLVSSGGKE